MDEMRKKRLKEQLFGHGDMEHEDPAMEQAMAQSDDKDDFLSDEGDGEDIGMSEGGEVEAHIKRKKRLNEMLLSPKISKLR